MRTEKNKTQELTRRSSSRSSRRSDQTLSTELVPIIPEGTAENIKQKISEKLEDNRKKQGSENIKDGQIKPNFSAIRMPDAGLPLPKIDEHCLLISFARIILPVGIGGKAKADKCACVMINDSREQILWSSNNRFENFRQEVENVVTIFRQLAEGEQFCPKESRRKLLERAILKDADYFTVSTSRTYGESFPECVSLWDEFSIRFTRFRIIREIEFYQQEEEEIKKSNPDNQSEEKIKKITAKIKNLEKKLNAGEQSTIKSEFKELSEEDLIKCLLEKRRNLLSHILEKISYKHNSDQKKIREGLRSLPPAIFKPLLNVSDLLIIVQQISEKSDWWQKMAALLLKEDSVDLRQQTISQQYSVAVGVTGQKGFQVVKAEKEMHAEMKMLEAFSNQEWKEQRSEFSQLNIANSKDNLCEFVKKATDSKQFAVTKRFCLMCDLTLSACEITSREIASTTKTKKTGFLRPNRKGESAIKNANRPGGMLFEKEWQAPGLRNKQLASDVKKNFDKLVNDCLEVLVGGGPQRSSVEEFWIEEQAVYANLEREKEDSLEFWFSGPLPGRSK